MNGSNVNVCSVLVRYVEHEPNYAYSSVSLIQSSDSVMYSGISFGPQLGCNDSIGNDSIGNVFGLGKMENQRTPSMAQYLKNQGVISTVEVGLCIGKNSNGHIYLGGTDRSLHNEPMVYALDSHPSSTSFTLQARAMYLITGGPTMEPQNPVIRIAGVTRNGNTLNHGSGYAISTSTTRTVLNAKLESIFRSAWKKLTVKSLPSVEELQSEQGVELSAAQMQGLPTILLQCIGYSSNTMTVGDPSQVPGYAAHLDSSNPYDVLLRITPDMYLTTISSSTSSRRYRMSIVFDGGLSFGGIIGLDILRHYSVLLNYDQKTPAIGLARADCDIVKSDSGNGSTTTNQQQQQQSDSANSSSKSGAGGSKISNSGSSIGEVPLKHNCNLEDLTVLSACDGTTATYRSIIQTQASRSSNGAASQTTGIPCDTALRTQYPHSTAVLCDINKGYCDVSLPCTDNQSEEEDDIFNDNISYAKDDDDYFGASPLSALECNRQQFGQCTLTCQQSRLVSYYDQNDDKLCKVNDTLTRDCSTGLCAKDLPCKIPYKIHLVLGLEYSHGDDMLSLSEVQQEDLLTALVQTLDKVHVGDLDITLVTPWTSEENDNNIDVELNNYSVSSSQGLKLVIEINIVNWRYNPTLDICDDVSNASFRALASSIQNRITSPSFYVSLSATNHLEHMKLYILQTWTIATLLGKSTTVLPNDGENHFASSKLTTLSLLLLLGGSLYFILTIRPIHHPEYYYRQSKRVVGANLMSHVRFKRSNRKYQKVYTHDVDGEEDDLALECT